MKKLSLAALITALLFALPFVFQAETATASTGCEGGVCDQFGTFTYTRVGATCSNARINAANAARAAASCSPSPDHACGPVEVFISTCSPNPNGAGYQASAYATFWCEFCP